MPHCAATLARPACARRFPFLALCWCRTDLGCYVPTLQSELELASPVRLPVRAPLFPPFRARRFPICGPQWIPRLDTPLTRNDSSFRAALGPRRRICDVYRGRPPKLYRPLYRLRKKEPAVPRRQGASPSSNTDNAVPNG